MVRVLSLNMSDRKNSKLGDFQPVGYGSSFSNCSKDIFSTIVKNVAMMMIMVMMMTMMMMMIMMKSK